MTYLTSSVCSWGEVRKGGWGLLGLSSPWLSDEGVYGGGTLRAWLAEWWKSDISCILCLRSLSKAAWDEAWKNLRPIHPLAASLVDNIHQQIHGTCTWILPISWFLWWGIVLCLRAHLTHTQAQAVWGRAVGTSARSEEGVGGQGVWPKPDTPSGTPAAAAEKGLPATSASAAPSGSDTYTLLTPATYNTDHKLAVEKTTKHSLPCYCSLALQVLWNCGLC